MAPRKATRSKRERKCADCGCDLSHRHYHTKRCTDCNTIRQQAFSDARVRRNSAERARKRAKRRCLDCGVSIAHRGGNSVRCIECQNVWRLARASKYAVRYNRERKARDPEYRAKLNATRRRWERRRRAIDPSFKKKARNRHHLPELVEDQDGLCGICGEPLPEDYMDGSKVHVDHILPVACGGGHDFDNLQAAHSHCNMTKGARVENHDARAGRAPEQ